MIRRKPPKKHKVLPEHAADQEAIRAAAVVLLARRDFASGELRQKLVEQGYDGTGADEVVAELVEGRIVDDARYGANYVAYHADRGQGPVRIAMDLRALGLSQEVIVEALASGPDWKALAREVRIRKFGLEAPDSWAEKGRQARFLQYRGFSSDHIRSAVGPDFDPDESS
jgi:regulatory protein